MSIAHLLNRTLTLYRTTTEPNDSGGFDEVRAAVRQVRVRISQPTATERLIARTSVGPQQGAAVLSVSIYAAPNEDVYRNDELQDDVTGDVWRVEAVLEPSKPGTYTLMDSRLIQKQPTNPGGTP